MVAIGDTQPGGGCLMAEWLKHWTVDLEVPGSLQGVAPGIFFLCKVGYLYQA